MSSRVNRQEKASATQHTSQKTTEEAFQPSPSRPPSSPSTLTTNQMVHLQGTIGNQAVQRLIQQQGIIQRDDLKPDDPIPSIQQAAEGRFKTKIKEEKKKGDYEKVAAGHMITALALAANAKANLDPGFTVRPASADNLIWSAIQAIVQDVTAGATLNDCDDFVNRLMNRMVRVYDQFGKPPHDQPVKLENDPAFSPPGTIMINAENTVKALFPAARQVAYQGMSDAELKAAALAINLTDPVRKNTAATAFLATKNIGNLQVPNPTEKKAWSKALKTMPTVKALLAGNLYAKPGKFKDMVKYKILHQEPPPVSGAAVAWDFPTDAKLYDETNKVDGADLDPHHPLWPNIREAWKRIKSLVDGNVLNQSYAPKLRVHPNNTFRAHYNDERHEIHVRQNQEIEVIVHEFGHHLELTLPSDLWVDIQRLLHTRHDAAVASGAQNKLGHIGADASAPMWDEPRYQANMPATGAYSAKAYKSGDTEVMSMTMEYLSQVDTAKKLIKNDPQQAALILKRIQPTEYTTHVGNGYDKFLT